MPDKIRVMLLGGYAREGWISISRYQRELIQGLRRLNDEQTLELTSVSPRPGSFIDGLSSTGPMGVRWASYWSRFVAYPQQLPVVSGAIYHILDQSLGHLADHLDLGRTVITCHDLIHFPLWRQRRKSSVWPWATDRLYRFCVRNLSKCAEVIAVSQKSKEDAVQYLGCDPRRITVVHEGVSPAFLKSTDGALVTKLRAGFASPETAILLYVGVPTYYKNAEGLLQAYAQLRRSMSRPLKLLHVGPLFTKSQYQLAQRLGIIDFIQEAGIQNDETLPLFYHLADCFVFPSLYEGFGFPPLEAMACGLPVVASKRGSLPEILGDAALLVDPEDPESIAREVRRVLEDSQLRQKLRDLGRKRAGQFQWKQCAKETLAVYQRVAGEGAA